MRAILSKLSVTALAMVGLAVSSVQVSAQSTRLFDWESSWRYNDETTSTDNLHGTGWEQPTYDTTTVAGWKDGTSLFGNDTAAGYTPGPTSPFTGPVNGFTTPLNRAIAAASDRVTFYFQKKFNYSGATANIILETSWVHDDGFIVYLNGVEILRSKMQVAAPDPVTWDTFGANHDAGGFPPVVPEGNQYTQDILNAPLVAGENVIAVELHQSSTTSSDCSFAMQMNAVIPFAPTISDTTQPTNRIVIENRSTTLSVSANGSRPLSYQWFFQPVGGGGFNAILDATNSTYTIASMQAADEGEYYCSVSNPVGSVDSRAAVVSFSTDSVPPSVVRVIGSADHNSVVVEFSELISEISATDPFNWEVAGTAGVASSVLNPGGKSVTLALAAPMSDNTLYTANVGLSGVQDLAGNTMPQVDVEFPSWSASACAGVTFEAYDTSDTAGTIVTLLTSHPNFPNNPYETFRLTTFDTREVYPDDSHEQYGGRLRALFIPPYSGAWRFFMNTDDSAEVWFNPNGPSPAGRVRIAQETGCCNAFSEPGTLRTSEPQNLIGGQAYYIEALYKEGTGGDYCRIAARADGDPTEAASLTPISGLLLGLPAAPVGAAGSFAISQQPSDQTTTPNSTATFTVGTTSDSLLCYQWRRNGADIDGAVGSQYSLVASPADNGAIFSVVISVVGGGSETSADATLTVEPDVTRPTVVSVSANAAGDSVVVTFSEPMDATTATDPFSYSINGLNPSSVTATSSTVVTLLPGAPLLDCDPNVLSVSGVMDLSANAINPNPTTVNFNKPIILVARGATWSYDDTATDLGTGWSQPGFDDSAWMSGPAPLGFEPAAAQIPVVATPLAAASANNTTYFRIHFNLATAPGSITRLQLTEVLDDGASYYFNGVEAHRTRMGAGPVAFATLANASGPEPTDGTHTVEGPTDIATTGLVYGDNVLAVEVHPSSATSSDSIFDIQLAATVTACVPPITITRSGSNVIVTWPDPTFTLESAPAVTGPWGTQAGISGVSLSATSGNLFLRLVKQ